MFNFSAITPPLWYYLLGMYWPFLFSLTGSFTISQGLFAILFSGLSIFFLSRERDKKLLFLFFSVIVLSITIFYTGMMAGGSLQRSLSDSIRLIFFMIYFAVGAIYANKSYFNEVVLIKLILYYCMISVFFSLIVYIPSLHFIVDLFKGRLSNDVLQFHFFRFSGFSGFPTDLGALLTLGICILLYERSLNIFSNRNRAFLFVVFCLGILGSVSRGAMLHLAVVLLLYILGSLVKLFFTARIHRYAFWGLVLLTISIPLLFTLLSFFGEHEIIKYASVDLSSPDASVLHRFKEVNGAINVLFEKFFLFGEARDRPLGLPVIEGYWTHWILRYSWFGLIIALVFGLFLAIIAKKSNLIIGRGISIWMYSFLLSEAFFSDVLFRFKGPLIYGFIFGICFTFCFKKYQSRLMKSRYGI